MITTYNYLTGRRDTVPYSEIFRRRGDFNSSHTLGSGGINVTVDGWENIVMHLSSKSLYTARATKCQTDVW